MSPAADPARKTESKRKPPRGPKGYFLKFKKGKKRVPVFKARIWSKNEKYSVGRFVENVGNLDLSLSHRIEGCHLQSNKWVEKHNNPELDERLLPLPSTRYTILPRTHGFGQEKNWYTRFRRTWMVFLPCDFTHKPLRVETVLIMNVERLGEKKAFANIKCLSPFTMLRQQRNWDISRGDRVSLL